LGLSFLLWLTETRYLEIDFQDQDAGALNPVQHRKSSLKLEDFANADFGARSTVRKVKAHSTRSPLSLRHVLGDAFYHCDKLRRTVRKDSGKVSFAPALAKQLVRQYLVAVVKSDPSLGARRSYPTVRRYMKPHDLIRKPPVEKTGFSRTQLRRRGRRR